MHTDKFRGPVARAISVRTNAVDRPNHLLTLKLDVLTSVELLPVDALRLANGRATLSSAELLVRRDASETGELQLGEIESTLPWIEVEAERLTDTRPASGGLPTGFAGDWLLRARIAAPPAEYGRHDGEVRFATGLAREPQVAIPVLVQLQPPVRTSAPELRLPAGGAEGTLLLTVRRDLDASILEVASDTEGLSWTLEPAGPRHYKVHVRREGAPAGVGTLIFKVGEETLRVPVTANP